MNAPAVKSFFSTHEVVVLTGFSKCMLDYLRREAIFAPSKGPAEGRGVRRRYTYTDVVLLRALHEICAGKGKIRHLKPALAKFRDEFGALKPGQRLDRCLFVQGDELCVRTASDTGRQLRSGQMTLGFFVDLGVVTQDIADCIVPMADGFALAVDVAAAAESVRQEAWLPIKAARQKTA